MLTLRQCLLFIPSIYRFDIREPCRDFELQRFFFLVPHIDITVFHCVLFSSCSVVAHILVRSQAFTKLSCKENLVVRVKDMLFSYFKTDAYTVLGYQIIIHKMEIPPLDKQIVPYHLFRKLAESQGLLGLFHHREEEVGMLRIGS